MAEKLDAAVAWKYLVEIGLSERHFNSIESTYRGLASTWVLASFAGMGFAINASTLPVAKGLVIFAVSVAGSLGVQLLWVVDLLAYHRLLTSYYLEGLRLEAQDASLPQIRWQMWAMGPVESRVKLFYSGCSLVLLPFGIVGALTAWPAASDHAVLIVASGIAPVVMTIVLWRLSYNQRLRDEVDRIRRAASATERPPA